MSKKPLELVSRVISSFGLIFCSIVLGFLSLASLLICYTFNEGKEIGDRLTLTSSPVHFFLTLLLLALIVMFLAFIFKKEKLPSWKKFLLVGCLIAFVFELVWIFAQNTTSTLEPDSKRLLEFASAIASGNKGLYFNEELPDNVSDMLDGTLYFAQYPYNLVAGLYFLTITRIFGDLAPVAFQISSAICNIGSIVALAFIFAALEKSNSKRVACVIMLCLCLPNLLYSGLLYCNQVGLFFVLCYVLFNILAMKSNERDKQRRYISISFLPLMLVCWIKSTFIIIGIAVIVCWVLYALRKSTLKSAGVASICCILLLVANATATIPKSAMESEIGYHCGEGTPTNAFIAMGLQHEYNIWANHPGWWNRYNNEIFEQTNGNYSEMEKLAAQSIQERANYFLTNPKGAASFFKEKLSSEWCAADFGAAYYSSLNQHVEQNGEVVKFMCKNSEGNMSSASAAAKGFVDAINPFMHAHMLFVYVFSCVACIALFKRRKQVEVFELVLPCIFAVGFFVYVLWEAKAQYALPFFMVLIPMSILGFSSLADKLANKFIFLHKDK